MKIVLYGGAFTKTLLIMKFLAIFLLVAILQAHARDTRAQGVTLSLKKARLETVFKEIRKQAGYNFVYNNNLVREAKRVDIEVIRAPVEEVLRRCFQDQPFTYNIIEKTIIIKSGFPAGLPSTPEVNDPAVARPVTGTVTNERGEPLAGVTILIKGTSNGVQTREDGSYSIEAPEGAVLRFSFVGYTSVEVPVGNKTIVNIRLVPRENNLNDVVITTGIRASNQRSLSIKRNSPEFVDAITAEDAGKFPDRNVAEALQRVAGVAIQRTRGEGDFVSIRGLGPEFVAGTINGRTIVSATESFNSTLSGGVESTAGRATNFDVLPSEIIESIQVYKTSSAENVEGGIGGLVNINTAKPLTMGRKYVLNARGVHSPFAGNTSPSVSGLGSWANRDKTFGALLSVSWSDRKIREDAVNSFGYAQTPFFGAGNINFFDTNGDGKGDVKDVLFPFSTNLESFREERKRLTFNGTLQWALSKNTELRLDASQSTRKLSYVSTQVILSSFPLNTSGLTVNPDGSLNFPSLVVDKSNTASGFTINSFDNITSITDFQKANDNILDGGLKLTHKAEDWLFSLDGSLSTAKADFGFERGSFLSADPATTQPYLPNLSVAIRKDAVVISPNLHGFNISDPNNLRTRNFDIRFKTNKDREYAFRGDVERKIHHSFLSAFKAGLRYSGRLRKTTQSQFFGQLPFKITPTDTSLVTLNVGASGVRTMRGVGDFFHGDYPVDYSQFLFPVDVREWRNLHEQAGGQFPVAMDPNNTYSVRENTMAGYVQLDLDGKLGEVPVTGNLGIRVVNTDVEVTGAAQELKIIPVGTVSYGQFTGSPLPYKQTSSYVKFLPSVNLRFKASEDVYARLAYSRSITRPQFNDLGGVDINFTQNLVNKAGNAALKPYQSDNFDVGIEWYTSRTGVLSTNFFYKRLSSFVTDITRTNYSFLGNNWVSFLTRENQGKGNIFGAEIGYQQPLTFLPRPLNGLGIISNFTFSNGEQFLNNGSPIAFPGVSRFSFNSALYFDNGGKFQARLAYTYRDKFLLLANDVFAQQVYVSAYGQVDGSASYKIIKNINFVAEVINLTGEKNKLFSTNTAYPAFGGNRPVAAAYVGPRFGLGVTASF